MAFNVGKSIVAFKSVNNSTFILYHDFVNALNTMTIKGGKDGTDIYTSDAGKFPTATEKYRVLMFKKTYSIYADEKTPLRMCPLVTWVEADETDAEGAGWSGDMIMPFYEVIGPTAQMLSEDSGLLTFWTNMKAFPYNFNNIYRVKQDQIDNLTGTTGLTRVLMGSMFIIREYWVEGGEVYGGEKTSGKTLIPLFSKPFIINKANPNLQPIFDFSGSGSSSGGGFRKHDHRDSSVFSGGFAFACFHPGSSLPQKPWERV